MHYWFVGSPTDLTGHIETHLSVELSANKLLGQFVTHIDVLDKAKYPF